MTPRTAAGRTERGIDLEWYVRGLLIAVPPDRWDTILETVRSYITAIEAEAAAPATPTPASEGLRKAIENVVKTEALNRYGLTPNDVAGVIINDWGVRAALAAAAGLDVGRLARAIHVTVWGFDDPASLMAKEQAQRIAAAYADLGPQARISSENAETVPFSYGDPRKFADQLAKRETTDG